MLGSSRSSAALPATNSLVLPPAPPPSDCPTLIEACPLIATAETAAPGGSAEASAPAEDFAAYRMHHLLGRGGMGEVWAAEQASLGRMVAVKRLIARGDGPHAAGRIADFRNEAHIAGLLEHPNILPVHDLGRDEAGNPLLAMKLVEGRPWNDLFDEDWERLSPDEFLSRHLPILAATSRAVAFAHSRGIVHRDLKPSQVMVGAFGEVLLTDWGLAIRMADGAGERRAPTSLRWQLASPGTASNPAGTPALMAPEQARKDSSGVGPWTDVYLLGGTLYLLLTGEYVHGAHDPGDAMERAARGEIVPPRVRAGGRPIPADLEELCLRALQADPRDRPAAAEAFWRALDDHLRGSTRRAQSREKAEEAARMLAAGPADYAAWSAALACVEEARRLWADNPACGALRDAALAGSARQALANGDLALARLQAESLENARDAARLLGDVGRAEAAVRRRRAQFRGAVGTLFVLFAVAAGGSILFTRALGTKNVELVARTAEAVEAQRVAEANLEIARRQGDGAFEMVNFVLRDLKSAMDAELGVDRGIPMPVANEIAHAIAGRVAEPVVAYFESAGVEEVARWPRELQLARADQMHATGERLGELGRPANGLALAEAALELRERNLPEASREIASSYFAIGSLTEAMGDFRAALGWFQRSFQVREAVFGTADLLTASSLNSVAGLLSRIGDNAGAEPLYRESLAITEGLRGPDHTDVAACLINLSEIYLDRREFEQASAMVERALAIQVAALGIEHPVTASSREVLARILFAQGKGEAGLPLLECSLSIREQAFGPEHPSTIHSVNSLASVLFQARRFHAARPLFERAIASYDKLFGPDHPSLADPLTGLGALLVAQKEYAAGLPILKRVLALRQEHFGPDSPSTAKAHGNLAACYTNMRDYAAARIEYERCLAIREAALGSLHPTTISSIGSLATIMENLDDPLEAQYHLERAAALSSVYFGADHPEAAAARARAFRNLARLARGCAEAGDAETAALWAGDAMAILGGQIADADTSMWTRALHAECLAMASQADEARAAAERLLCEEFPESPGDATRTDVEAFREVCRKLGIAMPQTAP